MDTADSFSARLQHRYRAVMRGRSQRLVAHRIGISHAILSRWLAGKSDPRASTLDRIVDWVEYEESRLH